MKKKWIRCATGEESTLKKFIFSFFLILFICEAIVCPSELSAQNREQISINKKNVLFDEIVKDIEAQTDYTFMYSTDIGNGIGKISVNVTNISIRQLMDLLLKDKPYTYQIDNKVVVLKNRPLQPSSQIPADQKKVKITGIVTDANGDPLPGAAVILKGTKIGVITNYDGSFELNIPEGNNLLVVSFLGMKPKEVDITGKNFIKVSLENAELSINEVVLTGIFKKSRESYTGALTTISANELKAAGNRNILTSISNIDPSFNIVDNLDYGSDPNRLPDITIRGRTSMDVNVRNLQEQSSVQNTSNLPLFIMDGFEVSLQRVMDMDEELVENITILKDASATAMYGSRGANGIVVITLKKPETGKLRVSYKGSINIEIPDFTSYNLMNAKEKLEYEKAANLYYSLYNTTSVQRKFLND
jgi:TonB-dependent SusC/RagA subfamily outer membrane receptor